MKGSATILAFFVAGCIAGRLGLDSSAIDADSGFYVLCLLMFFVGMSIGINPDMTKNFKTINPKALLLPLATILGTIAGTALLSLAHSGIAACDAMAVGAGFGYYSLSSIMITEYRGAELGTIALISNIIRELATLLCAPIIVKWFGPLALISSGGATTMDTTLPIIARYSGERFIPLSIFQGFVVDFSVPFLVALFCSLSIA